MRSGKAILFFSTAVNSISRVAHSVGAGVLAVMMFFTTLDVTLRYFFNRPIMGSFELTEYMMSIVISLGLAYCAMLKGHVNVDFVISRFSERTQTIINSITSLVALIIFFLISWQCIEQTKILKSSGLTSPILFIPTFPFLAALAFGCALTCLVFLTQFLDFLIRAARK